MRLSERRPAIPASSGTECMGGSPRLHERASMWTWRRLLPMRHACPEPISSLTDWSGTGADTVSCRGGKRVRQPGPCAPGGGPDEALASSVPRYRGAAGVFEVLFVLALAGLMLGYDAELGALALGIDARYACLADTGDFRVPALGQQGKIEALDYWVGARGPERRRQGAARCSPPPPSRLRACTPAPATRCRCGWRRPRAH